MNQQDAMRATEQHSENIAVETNKQGLDPSVAFRIIKLQNLIDKYRNI